MRPSRTVGAALLVLLAAHFPAGLALEEKKGKGVPAALRPALRLPRRRLRLWPGPWEGRGAAFLSCASLRRPEEGTAG